MYNILSIEKANGLELPKWTESVFPDKLLALAERNLAVLTETDYMKQIKGGETHIYYVKRNSSQIQLKCYSIFRLFYH